MKERSVAQLYLKLYKAKDLAKDDCIMALNLEASLLGLSRNYGELPSEFHHRCPEIFAKIKEISDAIEEIRKSERV